MKYTYLIFLTLITIPTYSQCMNDQEDLECQVVPARKPSADFPAPKLPAKHLRASLGSAFSKPSDMNNSTMPNLTSLRLATTDVTTGTAKTFAAGIVAHNQSQKESPAQESQDY